MLHFKKKSESYKDLASLAAGGDGGTPSSTTTTPAPSKARHVRGSHERGSLLHGLRSSGTGGLGAAASITSPSPAQHTRTLAEQFADRKQHHPHHHRTSHHGQQTHETPQQQQQQQQQQHFQQQQHRQPPQPQYVPTPVHAQQAPQAIGTAYVPQPVPVGGGGGQVHQYQPQPVMIPSPLTNMSQVPLVAPPQAPYNTPPPPLANNFFAPTYANAQAAGRAGAGAQTLMTREQWERYNQGLDPRSSFARSSHEQRGLRGYSHSGYPSEYAYGRPSVYDGDMHMSEGGSRAFVSSQEPFTPMKQQQIYTRSGAKMSISGRTSLPTGYPSPSPVKSPRHKHARNAPASPRHSVYDEYAEIKAREAKYHTDDQLHLPLDAAAAAAAAAAPGSPRSPRSPRASRTSVVITPTSARSSRSASTAVRLSHESNTDRRESVWRTPSSPRHGRARHSSATATSQAQHVKARMKSMRAQERKELLREHAIPGSVRIPRADGTGYEDDPSTSQMSAIRQGIHAPKHELGEVREEDSVFCLEVFVQYVEDLIVPCKKPALAFRLLDFPTILVQAAHGNTWPHNGAQKARGQEDSLIPFERGKSCLFRLRPTTLTALLKRMPLYGMIVDIADEHNAVLLGMTSIDLSCFAVDMTLPFTSSKKGFRRGTFPLYNFMGSEVGNMELVLRLSHLGSALVPHIHNLSSAPLRDWNEDVKRMAAGEKLGAKPAGSSKAGRGAKDKHSRDDPDKVKIDVLDQQLQAEHRTPLDENRLAMQELIRRGTLRSLGHATSPPDLPPPLFYYQPSTTPAHLLVHGSGPAPEHPQERPDDPTLIQPPNAGVPFNATAWTQGAAQTASSAPQPQPQQQQQQRQRHSGTNPLRPMSASDPLTQSIENFFETHHEQWMNTQRAKQQAKEQKEKEKLYGRKARGSSTGVPAAASTTHKSAVRKVLKEKEKTAQQQKLKQKGTRQKRAAGSGGGEPAGQYPLSEAQKQERAWANRKDQSVYGVKDPRVRPAPAPTRFFGPAAVPPTSDTYKNFLGATQARAEQELGLLRSMQQNIQLMEEKERREKQELARRYTAQTQASHAPLFQRKKKRTTKTQTQTEPQVHKTLLDSGISVLESLSEELTFIRSTKYAQFLMKQQKARKAQAEAVRRGEIQYTNPAFVDTSMLDNLEPGDKVLYSSAAVPAGVAPLIDGDGPGASRHLHVPDNLFRPPGTPSRDPALSPSRRRVFRPATAPGMMGANTALNSFGGVSGYTGTGAVGPVTPSAPVSGVPAFMHPGSGGLAAAGPQPVGRLGLPYVPGQFPADPTPVGAVGMHTAGMDMGGPQTVGAGPTPIAMLGMPYGVGAGGFAGQHQQQLQQNQMEEAAVLAALPPWQRQLRLQQQQQQQQQNMAGWNNTTTPSASSVNDPYRLRQSQEFQQKQYLYANQMRQAELERQQAAIKLQARFRGYRQRKSYKNLRRSKLISAPSRGPVSGHAGMNFIHNTTQNVPRSGKSPFLAHNDNRILQFGGPQQQQYTTPYQQQEQQRLYGMAAQQAAQVQAAARRAAPNVQFFQNMPAAQASRRFGKYTDPNDRAAMTLQARFRGRRTRRMIRPQLEQRRPAARQPNPGFKFAGNRPPPQLGIGSPNHMMRSHQAPHSSFYQQNQPQAQQYRPQQQQYPQQQQQQQASIHTRLAPNPQFFQNMPAAQASRRFGKYTDPNDRAAMTLQARFRGRRTRRMIRPQLQQSRQAGATMQPNPNFQFATGGRPTVQQRPSINTQMMMPGGGSSGARGDVSFSVTPTNSGQGQSMRPTPVRPTSQPGGYGGGGGRRPNTAGTTKSDNYDDDEFYLSSPDEIVM